MKNHMFLPVVSSAIFDLTYYILTLVLCKTKPPHGYIFMEVQEINRPTNIKGIIFAIKELSLFTT